MNQTYDYVIIGSGFGGSVSAMRLTEKGYSVLVLEKGKRYEDKDFAKTNWQFWKYLWLPILRAHGILQVSILKIENEIIPLNRSVRMNYFHFFSLFLSNELNLE